MDVTTDTYKVYLESDKCVLIAKVKDCLPFQKDDQSFKERIIEKLRKKKMWTTLDTFHVDYTRAFLEHVNSSPENIQAVQETQSAVSLEIDDTTRPCQSSIQEKTQVIQEPQRLTISICEGDDTTPLSRSSSPENIQETQSTVSLESDVTTLLSQSSSPENIQETQSSASPEIDVTTLLSQSSSPENIQETQSTVSLEIDDTTRPCQSSIQEKTQVIQERQRSTSFESGDTLPLSQSCPETAQAVQECQSDETTPLSVSSSQEKTQVIKEPQRLTIYIYEGDDTTPLSRSSSPENIQETQSPASLEIDVTTLLSQSSSPENIQETQSTVSLESDVTTPLSQSSSPENIQETQSSASPEIDVTTLLSQSLSPENIQETQSTVLLESDDTTPLSQSSSPENIQETQSSASLESDDTTPLSQSSSQENSPDKAKSFQECQSFASQKNNKHPKSKIKRKEQKKVIDIDESSSEEIDFVEDSDFEEECQSFASQKNNKHPKSKIKRKEEQNKVIDIDESSSEETDFVEDSDFEEEGTDVGHVETHIREKHMERDINIPGIYIRKYRKSRKCKSGHRKTGDRVYDNYHVCLFCQEPRQHIKTHLQTHKDIPEVKKLIDDPSTNYTAIRKLGDHKNNVRVLNKGYGEVILSRRPKDRLDISQFGPCPACKEWVLLKNIKTHFRSCSTDKIKITKGQLIIQSQVISGVIGTKPSKLMLEEVFPRMMRDEISEVATKDVLIVALGESWLRRSVDNKAKRRHYASEHMRLMARMLINLRKQDTDGQKSLDEYLSTRYFEDLMTAALNCCIPNMDDVDELESPSNAIKLKYDIRRVVNAKWSLLVREDPHSLVAEEMQTLLGLITLEWGERLIKLARNVLVRRRFVMKKELPSPDDIAVLTRYIVDELKSIALTPENFFRVVQLAQTRLLTFNKRRSGEIDVISLDSYAAKTKDVDEIDQSLVSDLTKVELHLLKSQEMMTVRGKGHRPVPVLIPEEMKAHLQYISSPSTREAVGVKGSQYLFPNKVGQYTRAYESLKKTCSECNLVAPGRITSVSMRKYTATLAQGLNLNKYQLDWLCRHLGHTGSVHKVHYRHMSGMIERVQMAKLFLIQDLNLTGQFKGKNLEEIDVSDIVFPDGNVIDGEDVVDTDGLCDGENTGTSYINADVFDNIEESDEAENSSEDEGPEYQGEQEKRQRKPKQKKPVHRQKWDADEVQEIHVYFKSFLDLKKCPRKKAIDLAKKQSKAKGGKLWKRSNDKIVKKISNMNKKI